MHSAFSVLHTHELMNAIVSLNCGSFCADEETGTEILNDLDKVTQLSVWIQVAWMLSL
jgi:hypothetical protein